ncbi:MAG: hypothetical protein KA953_03645 [Lachnospiraceae bacterium]|nr:hypothetical protein [Lachnospiraceae bacterium]
MKKIWVEYGNALLTMVITSLLIGILLFSGMEKNPIPQLNNEIGQVFRI